MPAPAAEGAGNGAQGLSAPMKWLCDHIRWSLNADEDKMKRLLSSDSRFCLRVTTHVSLGARVPSDANAWAKDNIATCIMDF